MIMLLGFDIITISIFSLVVFNTSAVSVNYLKGTRSLLTQFESTPESISYIVENIYFLFTMTVIFICH